MTRCAALVAYAALFAPPAFACAVPPSEAEAPVSACAPIRVDAAHACIDDPSAPGGYRIVSAMDPSLPDCATGVAGRCVQPVPAEERGLLRRALTILWGS